MNLPVRPDNDHSVHLRIKTMSCSFCRLTSYEIKDNTILVKCTLRNNQRIALRCKIWPTPKNFGLNKIEATLNGAFLWKKGLWFYNAKSSRDFTIDDDITLTAVWNVTLRTPAMFSKHPLPPHDPRRSQGPFCVDYLALKEEGRVLIEYKGDESKLPENSVRFDNFGLWSVVTMVLHVSIGVNSGCLN